MRIELEGTNAEIANMLETFARGVWAQMGGASTPNVTLTVDTVSPVTDDGGVTLEPTPDNSLQEPVVEGLSSKTEPEKPADELPKHTSTTKRVSRKTPEGSKPDFTKTASFEPEKSTSPELSVTQEPVTEKSEKSEPAKIVEDTSTVVDATEVVEMPADWNTWSDAKQKLWVTRQTDLAPSQKLKILLDAQAARKVAEKAVEPTDTTTDTTTDTATDTTTDEPAASPRGESTFELPDWGKWSLAKRIVKVTSLNAADTDRAVELLLFRKEVGEVTEDNLQVARRKLQIAMRLRDQIETGKKGK